MPLLTRQPPPSSVLLPTSSAGTAGSCGAISPEVTVAARRSRFGQQIWFEAGLTSRQIVDNGWQVGCGLLVTEVAKECQHAISASCQTKPWQPRQVGGQRMMDGTDLTSGG